MPTHVLTSKHAGTFTVELLVVDEETELHVRDLDGNSIYGSPGLMAMVALEILHATHDHIEVR